MKALVLQEGLTLNSFASCRRHLSILDHEWGSLTQLLPVKPKLKSFDRPTRFHILRP